MARNPRGTGPCGPNVSRRVGDRRRVGPQAAALLVLELAYADTALTAADREVVAAHLRDRWGLAARGSPSPEHEQERKTRFAEYAVRLRPAFRAEPATRSGRADVARRVQRRYHRAARGTAHAPGGRAAGPRPGRSGRGPRSAPAVRPAMSAAASGCRSIGISGSKAFATSSRSRPDTAPTPWRRTCATCAGSASSLRRVVCRDPQG